MARPPCEVFLGCPLPIGPPLVPLFLPPAFLAPVPLANAPRGAPGLVTPPVPRPTLAGGVFPYVGSRLLLGANLFLA